MKIDVANAYNWVKKNLFTKRAVAVGIMLVAIVFSYTTFTGRVIPMAYGTPDVEAVGADPTDLISTGVGILTAIIGFVAQKYLGVQPELIQAVIAFEKDKSNSENQRRLGAAIIGYIIGVIGKHPDGSGGFVLSLLSTLVNELEPGEIKTALSQAATQVAVAQFKVSANSVGVSGNISMNGVKV